MADKPPQKPRRDLRARLGRTITPKNEPGGDAAADPATPPSVASAAAPAAAPAKSTPAPRIKGTPPPPGGIAAPPASIGMAQMPGSEVAPPPFARPAVSAPVSEAPSDPFAASTGPAQQVVRVEFDERLVADAEVGKGGKMIVVLAAVVSLIAGAGLGWSLGEMLTRRTIRERTIRDAQAVYASVDESAGMMDTISRRMNAIVTAAAGNPAEGTARAVDYESIEALQRIEKPFDAAAFTNRNYNALGPQNVNDLFLYLINIETIFRDIAALAAETLPESRRTELDRTAAETDSGATTNYGAVLARAEDGTVLGTLAYLEVQPPAEEGGTPQILARLTRGGQGRAFQLFTGGTEEEPQVIGTNQEFVLSIDNAASRGVLFEQMGAFGRYVQRIAALKQLVDATNEIAGRLRTAIANALQQEGASVRAE
jgi:hypothetical protein